MDVLPAPLWPRTTTFFSTTWDAIRDDMRGTSFLPLTVPVASKIAQMPIEAAPSFPLEELKIACQEANSEMFSAVLEQVGRDALRCVRS